MRLIVLCLASVLAASSAIADETMLWRGAYLTIENCGTCHAVGTADASTHKEAPEFRTLSARYPVANLAEALVEGIMSGHPDMPEFAFDVDEADAIIAYLESIQDD